ncbi:integrating conjugative element relaxase, PFL_4751 family [Pseudomonas asplenii]|uniref:Integrating conjugative element relaxase, PFL_4751 family n=1 Tax=Pseudomonas asplenii TaxID=53407 RepID=A0A0N0E3N9_9PSED|nr:MobH family relaxase [Pseudomonas fuscovaginae]KPA90338.1 integrating conjugative element relaxase, PFL_4751 family [Pseudomonas fuscovaginae]
MLWRWMLRKKAANPTTDEDDEPPAQYTTPQSASELLSTPRRKKLMAQIWQLTSLSRQQFADLYQYPIERYAELVQQLPASENHHHAYLGGMLDHGLEIVVYALKLRQSHLLPAGAGAEAQASQTEAWTLVIAYAALLHDMGKIIVDVEVQLSNGTWWHPWKGPLNKPYRFKYVKGREYKLHGAAAGILLTRILPESTLDWLITYREPWTALLYVLAGQYEHAGILGELVVQADQASVAKELGGAPSKALAAPKSSLQRRLVEGLRFLVTEQLKINQTRASDGWLTEDALWLVSKTVADRLRAHLLSQGTDGVPSSNATLFDIMQDNSLILPNAHGKAIWNVTIQNGKWRKTLTFFKVAPALIWDTEQRPPVFAGSVTIELDSEAGEEGVPPASDLQPIAENSASPQDPSQSRQPPVQGAFALEVPSHHLTDVPDFDEPPWAEDLGDPTAFDPSPDTHTTWSEEEAEVHSTQAEPIPASRQAPSSAPQQPAKPPQPTSPHPKPKAHSLQPTASADDLGKAFIKWLRHGILSNKIPINDATAKVHSVAGTAFLISPGIFKRYTEEHPEVAHLAKLQGTNDWRWLQRCFDKLGVHHKSEDGQNVWTCEIKGPRKTRDIKGYLLKDPMLIFSEQPYDNPYLRVKE